jgi:hypothetical protein
MGKSAVGAEAEKLLAGLAIQLKAAFGDDLLSVVLYGSAARGDHFGRGSSDLNVAVVLRDISLESLERGKSAGREWVSHGNKSLLFLSPEWIRSSCDVFPMEFMDIIESHQVVSGSDPFADLTVSRENLRLQCESEIKIKLLHLRTGYMELHDNEEALARLLAASYGPMIAVCRGVLRAAGQPVQERGEDVLMSVATMCGLDTEPFSEVAAIKRGGPGAASVAMKPLFRRYHAQVETLARSVDAGFSTGAKQ